jgi:hypothetical protein
METCPYFKQAPSSRISAYPSGLGDAGEDFKQGAFASSITADDADDFTALYLKRTSFGPDRISGERRSGERRAKKLAKS